MEKFMNRIEKYFKINERNTTIKKEIMGGVIIFLSMAYILVVNPNMLAEAGMDWNAVFMATAIAAGVTTIMMGVLANLPIGLAPGLGVSAFFTYNVVMTMEFTYAQALAIVFLSGLMFLALSVSGLRKKAINAIPIALKHAIGAGIGFFIGYIGFKNAGIVEAGQGTFTQLGDFTDPAVILGLFGIVLLVVLFFMKVKGFMIIALLSTVVLGLILSASGVKSSMPHAMPVIPDNFGDLFSGGEWASLGSTAGKLFKEIPKVLSTAGGWVAIFVFLFVDFFDTAGTIVVIGSQTKTLNEDGSVEGGERAMLVDALGTIGGSMLGTSTVTSFIESGTGISAGARTGLAAITTGFMFLISIFILPIFQMFTAPITALALVGVGMMMLDSLGHLNWEDKVETFTAFITISIMMLSFTVYWGIIFGFIMYSIGMLASKRYKEVPIATWVMTVVSLVFVIIEFAVVR